MPPAAHFPLAGKVGKGALKRKPFRSGFPLRIPFARPRDPAGPLGSPGPGRGNGGTELAKRHPTLRFPYLDHEPGEADGEAPQSGTRRISRRTAAAK